MFQHGNEDQEIGIVDGAGGEQVTGGVGLQKILLGVGDAGLGIEGGEVLDVVVGDPLLVVGAEGKHRTGGGGIAGGPVVGIGPPGGGEAASEGSAAGVGGEGPRRFIVVADFVFGQQGVIAGFFGGGIVGAEEADGFAAVVEGAGVGAEERHVGGQAVDGAEIGEQGAVGGGGGIEGDDGEHAAGGDRRVGRKGIRNAVVERPVREIHFGVGGVGDFDEFEMVAAGGRVVHQFADDERADAGAAVGGAERAADHGVAAAGAVGPAAEGLAVGGGAELDVVDEADEVAAGVGLDEVDVVAVGAVEGKIEVGVAGTVEMVGFVERDVAAGGQDGSVGDGVLAVVGFVVAEIPAADGDGAFR